MIILIIVAVLVLSLFLPVHVMLQYDGKSTKLWLRYLFIKFYIIPKKPKKPQKPKKSRKPKKPKKPKKTKTPTKPEKPENIPENQSTKNIPENSPKTDTTSPNSTEEKSESRVVKIFKAHGLSGVIDILEELIDIVKKFLGSVLKHIIVRKMILKVKVGGEDAYHTAMNFGYFCSGVYPVLGVLSALITFRKIPDIDIKADFDRKKSDIFMDLQISSRPFFLLASLVIYGIKAVKLYLNITRTDENTNENSKDGA